MSTGLTYVNITDIGNIADPMASGSYVFSSYEEAYKFGDWYCRLIQNLYGVGRAIVICIYTTSPSNSGYWDCGIVPPTFTSFD